MIKLIFKLIFNFLFFKAFTNNFRKPNNLFLHSDLSFIFLILIFFFFSIFVCLIFLIFYFLVNILKIFKLFLNFFFFIINNLYIWILSHFFSFFFNCLFFFHKIRFVFFFGTSYFDPLLKVLMDRISILKGELLMDFYNFSNKFIFESSFNIPISVFSYTPFFESSKNFFHVKTFYNLQHNLIYAQNKSRTYFYFYFKKQFSLIKTNNFLSNSKFNKPTFPFSIYSSELLFTYFRKVILSIIIFFFNFFSSDFFIFLNRLNLLLLNNSSLSLFRILFLKYFAYLRSCFTFLLINLEHDSFLNYIQVFLYKLSLRQYFSKNEWDNLFNTYDLQFTSSYPFDGSKKFDIFMFFKITYFYFFIYFNYFVFLFFFFSVIIFKFIYYLFIYLFQFFNIYINFFFFFFYLVDFFYFFVFSYFVSFFIFFKKLIFLPSYNYLRKPRFINLGFFHYFTFFVSLFLLNILYYFKLFFAMILKFFNKSFLFAYLIRNPIFSYNVLQSLDSFFFFRTGFFYSYLIDVLNYFNFKNFSFSNNYYPVINIYWQNYIFYFKTIQLSYLNFFYFPFVSSRFLQNSILIKIFFFTKLLRSYFFSILISFNILYENKKKFDSKINISLFSKNFFFIDYFIDILIYCFLFPFSIVFKFLKNFSLGFVFYFINFFFECLNLWKFFLWFCFSILYYCIIHSEFFLCLIFLIFLFYCISISFFSFFFYLLYVYFFIFIFYELVLFLSSFVFVNKFFIYFNLLLKIKFSLFFNYSKSNQFFKYRNLGFLETVGIFFLVRNELKKYELVQRSIPYINFNSLNTDILLNNFLNNLLNSNYQVKGATNKFLSVFSFLNFKSKFFPVLDSFSNFKTKNSRNNFLKIQIKSDFVPEFEYHKYLRSRDSRNFSLFRFRKKMDPKDIYFDSALDDVLLFKTNGSSNNYLNFDFTRSFYNDDFIFNKEINFFRNVFSRKNLSFFYDDLDSLSNFRITFSKIPPLFRYFYLKREKMKYLFSMYTFGNINYFSFSILLNWILLYRILRVTRNLFFSFNNSFLLFNSRKIPRFSLFNVSFFLDYIILKLNLFLDLIFYSICIILFILLFDFSFISMLLLAFFIFRIFFVRPIFLNLSFYLNYIRRRPLFLSSWFLFFSFFDRISFLFVNNLIYKKFGFFQRFFLNLSVLVFFFFFFLLEFNFSIFIFPNFSFTFFFEQNSVVLCFFNVSNFNLFIFAFSILEIFFIIFLNSFFIIIIKFIVIKFSTSKFYFFDKFVIILFFRFILLNSKFFKFPFLSKFGLLSPSMLIHELDFLIKIFKNENKYIKTNYFK